MTPSIAVPCRRDEPEFLDEPTSVLAELPGNLSDIRLLNRWFGGLPPVLFHLQRLTGTASRLTILDVATGSGDIPSAVVRWARARDMEITAVGLDISPEVLAEANRVTAPSDVHFISGDARALPFADAAFDVVLCSLALHHFPPQEAIVVLQEMWRVARSAVVVSDLRRSYSAYLGTWLATRTVARNRLTRHDGPLSVLRAYTPDELLALAQAAGWPEPAVRRHLFFHQTLSAHKEPSCV
jgi:2-polyprenyl-3-methyl-5-hydroxy-6-metoxy-1,4-benzoquinol methylase